VKKLLFRSSRENEVICEGERERERGRERVVCVGQTLVYFKIKSSTIGNTSSSSGVGEAGSQTEKKRTQQMSVDSTHEKQGLDIKSLSTRPPIPRIKNNDSVPVRPVSLGRDESVHRTSEPDSSCQPADRLKFAHPKVSFLSTKILLYIHIYLKHTYRYLSNKKRWKWKTLQCSIVSRSG
jgi:hypothetical protein